MEETGPALICQISHLCQRLFKSFYHKRSDRLQVFIQSHHRLSKHFGKFTTVSSVSVIPGSHRHIDHNSAAQLFVHLVFEDCFFFDSMFMLVRLQNKFGTNQMPHWSK